MTSRKIETGEFDSDPTVKMNEKKEREEKPMIDRVGWDEYFMRIAIEVAGRSTCDRKRVGAVIVRDRNILSTGYNGSVSGLPHCDEMGHMMENGHCIATIHAEANSIIQAAKNGVMINGASIYTTASPCWNCFKIIANAGMRRVFFGEFYRDDRIFSIAEKLGIELVDLSGCLRSQDFGAEEPERDRDRDEVKSCPGS